MSSINKKLKEFENLCVDWDYRNIDMTEPHLQGIEIIDNDILVNCELFSPEVDDYVSCNGGIINDKNIVKKFEDLDLTNKEDVLDFITVINNYINWEEVNTNLSDEVDKELIGSDEYDDFEEIIVPVEKLGEGWNWHKYDDGSGYLESPEGKEYMSYDLCTNEYMFDNNSDWEFFPLSYYYADGIEPSEFKAFDFMENEIFKKILSKEKDSLEL